MVFAISALTSAAPPVAALQNLQAKVKGFSGRRNKALSEPVEDEREKTAFRDVDTKTTSRGGTQPITTKDNQVVPPKEEGSGRSESESGGRTMPSGGGY